MKVLILSFSNNIVDEDSFIPNKKGLTLSCVEVFEEELKQMGYKVEYICMNKRQINKCFACGPGGWGKCWDDHKCIQNDEFNDIYDHMSDFDAYIFVTPVYFKEMSESAKVFFDRLKRCDAFNGNSNIKGKSIICVACAGGSGDGTVETLNSFDILNYFLKTNMIGRIPVTRSSFEAQKKHMIETVHKFESI